jgi:hypothetical protein
MDPVDELAELLVVMRRQSRTANIALSRVEHNRFNLLMVHAIAAILIGVLFMASAPTLVGPIWNVLDNIPLFPYSFAGILCAGGLILLPGSIARQARMEYVGLGLIYLWYLILAIGFFIPTAAWCIDALQVAFNARDKITAARPSFYAWVVYLHLALIMRVHMWTLRNIRRQEAAAIERVQNAQATDQAVAEELRRWSQKPPQDGGSQ